MQKEQQTRNENLMNIYSGIEAVIQVSAPTRTSNMGSVAKRDQYTCIETLRSNANGFCARVCVCMCATL